MYSFPLCFLLNRENYLSHMLIILKYPIYPYPQFAHERTRINFNYSMSFVCFHIFQYKLFTVYFLIQCSKNKLTKSEMVNRKMPLPKNTAIYVSLLTYMAVFFSVWQASYLKSFFIPAGCLG